MGNCQKERQRYNRDINGDRSKDGDRDNEKLWFKDTGQRHSRLA